MITFTSIAQDEKMLLVWTKITSWWLQAKAEEKKKGLPNVNDKVLRITLFIFPWKLFIQFKGM